MAVAGTVRGIAGLLHDAWIEYQRDRARYLAMAIIYYAAICLVPMLLLALSTLGLLLRYSTTAVELEREMLLTIETRFGAQMSATITGLLDGLQRDSIVVTVIGVVGMLVGASLLFRQLRMTFCAVWHYEPPSVAGPIRFRVFTIIREWIIAFVITLAGGALLLLGVVIVSAFRWLARLLARVPILPGVGLLVAVVSSFALAAITYGALLKVLPPRAVRWRDLLPSVLLCAGIWVVASELLPLYHRFVGETRNAYNAIGALLPVLVLVNLGAQSLFYGAELCKVMTRRSEASTPAHGLDQRQPPPTSSPSARHVTRTAPTPRRWSDSGSPPSSDPRRDR
jgi:membrane protein